MPHVAEDLVYHYTRASTAFEFILQDRQLRLSPITETNDPCEGESLPVSVEGPAGSGDILRALTDRLLDTIQSARLIASFTRDTPAQELPRTFPAPVLGWQRDRMWAQYADNFRGVCLAFDRAVLEKHALAVDAPHRVFFGDVTYELEPPYPRALKVGASGTPDPRAEQAYLEQWARARFLSKRPDWAGEWEYRVAAFGGDGWMPSPRQLFLPISRALRKIYVGSRFSDGYRPCVEAVCRREAVSAYQYDPAWHEDADPYFTAPRRSQGRRSRR